MPVVEDSSRTSHAEQPDTKALLVNSVVAAVLATAATIFIHEVVHLLTGLVLGHAGTLYPFGVLHDGTLTNGETAATAIAAPVISLVTGWILLARLPRPAAAGFGHLFLFWLAATSFMEGAGYLVITPFGAGDTAATVDALGWPGWTALVLAVLGIGLMFLGARMLAPHVIRLAGRDRTPGWALAFHPWWIGTIVNMGLSIAYLSLADAGLTDGEATAVVAGSMALLVLGPMSFIFQGKLPDQRRTHLAPGISVPGLAALVAMVALNVLLVAGRHIG